MNHNKNYIIKSEHYDVKSQQKLHYDINIR